MEIEEVFRSGMFRISPSQPENPRPKLSPAMSAQDLRDGLAALETVHTFSSGMIVRQKRSCRIYRDLGPDGLAVVVRLLDQPVLHPETDNSSTHYHGLLTLVIGQRTSDGDFATHHVDGRRYEPVPDDELTD